MNYPYPNNGYAALPHGYPYAYYAYPYPDVQTGQAYSSHAPASSTTNYLASKWHAGFSPGLVMLVMATGVIGWWQFGRAFLNGDSSK